ncbi:hypothetical protein ALC62_09151 [Cyphomyrmex costatus]|uniref:Mariner Mos1 transposase n=1 Tax=Cyphomyrmex costatus TaxID=456900 RepID=A0A195CJ45_9HYME|nr:hypothetical protein ALC62_09151 [Cyphomyrmex costatus]
MYRQICQNSHNRKKVKDVELEEILNENSCQTQLELANTLGVTQQDVSYRLKQLGRSKLIKKGRELICTPNNKCAIL